MSDWARDWSQAEDGRPGRTIDAVSVHEETPFAWGRWICPVRMPWHTGPRVCVVLRAYMASTSVTAALDAYPVRTT